MEPAAGAPKDSTKLEKNSKAREKEAASKIGRTHYMKELKAQMAVMKRARSDLDYLVRRRSSPFVVSGRCC